MAGNDASQRAAHGIAHRSAQAPAVVDFNEVHSPHIASGSEGSKVSLLEVIMRFIMIRPSHYISNSASATVETTLACAVLLVVCFGARSASADGLPESDPQLARQQTVAVPSNALVSPDGNRSVWMKEDGSGFWLAERTTPHGTWGHLREVAIRGVVRSPVFSPDGSKLAFENARGGYSTQDPNIWGPTRAYSWGFIAVFSFVDGHISYVNPSFAEDGEPHWTNNDTISYTRRIEGQPDSMLTAKISGAAGSPRTDSSESRALLEALLAAPFVFQPARAADGRSLAFAARTGRDRAIYFMRAGGAARKLVGYGEDDGQDLSELALSRDGSLLSFVRGGPPNSKGEIPNPRSLKSPPLRQVWLVGTDGSAGPRLVATGYAPQFSPDDGRLIWLTARGVASAPLSRKNGRVNDVGTSEYILAGSVSAPRFSADGRRVAYERSTYIEVLDLAARSTWAIAKPADTIDVDPVWSPDGRSIAFRRFFGHQQEPETGYAGEYIAAEPWAILTANLGSREIRQIWRAERGIGSAYYDLDQDPTHTGAGLGQLFWSDSNDIGFTWERDGWRHLYAVSALGGEPRLLTPGDGEVESAALSFDRKHLVYSTNIGDLERRHIAMVDFTGGPPTPVTAGRASQWAPVPLGDGGLAFIDAGWATPPAVMMRDTQGKITAAGGPAASKSFPSTQMLEPQPVAFSGVDGQRAYGQLFIPAKPSGCGVVFVHGGITRQMLLGFHYMEAYSNLYELNQYFSIQGCAVLSVEYRSSIMRGYAFRNAPGWGNAGASEYKDVLGGANYLTSRADLHVGDIGIYGLSWGGYLTAQALARNSDVFKVGFDMAGVHEFPGATFKYSPVAFAEQWHSPVYFAAGDDDRNVDFNQSMVLIQALRSKPERVEIAVKVIPNETHDLSLTFEDLTDVYWEGSEFMLNHLLRSH
jgi:dipeptidyl aminopeptidase/acylaminoacyl peptidase